MKLKNYLTIFIIFMIFLCGVSAISAASDDTMNMTMYEQDSDMESISVNEADTLKSASDNEVIRSAEDANDILTVSKENTLQKSSDKSKSTGTFTDLKKLIDGAKDKLTLTKNYTYNPTVDKDLSSGILISKSLELNGNGMTINGNKEARIFQIDGDDVKITGLTLINAYIDTFGGAIYWDGKDGSIENSTFINNRGQSGAAIMVRNGKITIEGNRFENNIAEKRAGAIMVVGFHARINNNIFKNNHARYGESDDASVYSKYPSMIDSFENNTFINNTKIDPVKQSKLPKKGSSKAISDDSSSQETYSRNYYSNNNDEESSSYNSQEYSTMIVGSNNEEIPIYNNQITLDTLNKLFNFDFTNGVLLVYLDGKLIFNGTTKNDLTQIIYDMLKLLSDQHELSVEFTDENGKTNTYKENITFRE